MKKLLTLVIAGMVVSAHANELKNFDEIYASITEGKNIRMVINFDGCSPKPPIANLHVYTSPQAIMLRKDYLQFANSPLTTNNPKYPKKPILENCTYKINHENEVHITTRVITLPDYSVVSEMQLVCHLGEDVKVYN